MYLLYMNARPAVMYELRNQMLVVDFIIMSFLSLLFLSQVIITRSESK